MIPSKNERIERLKKVQRFYGGYFTAADLAEIWGVSRRTIYNWKNEGRLPAYDMTLFKPWKWRIETLVPYLESGHA